MVGGEMVREWEEESLEESRSGEGEMTGRGWSFLSSCLPLCYKKGN